jgi:hypothetical protein
VREHEALPTCFALENAPPPPLSSLQEHSHHADEGEDDNDNDGKSAARPHSDTPFTRSLAAAGYELGEPITLHSVCIAVDGADVYARVVQMFLFL